MSSSEASVQVNCGNGKGDSLSSTSSELKDAGTARNASLEPNRVFSGAPALGNSAFLVEMR